MSYGGFTHVGFPLRTSVCVPALHSGSSISMMDGLVEPVKATAPRKATKASTTAPDGARARDGEGEDGTDDSDAEAPAKKPKARHARKVVGDEDEDAGDHGQEGAGAAHKGGRKGKGKKGGGKKKRRVGGSDDEDGPSDSEDEDEGEEEDDDHDQVPVCSL